MILLFAIILGAVCADQLTKWLAVVYLQGEPSFPLWQDVLHFTFVKNQGAAFGMLAGQRWIFMVVSSVAIVAVLVYLIRWRPKSLWVQISLAMIVGGGIGNMIDRVTLGYVIDFIDFTLINFAVFNVADSFITVGAFMMIGYLVWDMIREARQEKKEKPSDEESAVEQSNEQ
ncbi:MAG: signal peptidase II [Clostridia bacterium]|nr:signal peptidase II [Clostridia bacterium]